MLLKNWRRGLAQHNVPDLFRLPALKSRDLYEVTVKDLQHHMSQGKINAVDYVTYCLERIRVVGIPFFLEDLEQLLRRTEAHCRFLWVTGEPLP